MKRPFITLCIFLFIGIISAHFIKYSVPIYYFIFALILTLVSLLFYERVHKPLLIFTIITLGAYLYGQSMAGDILLEFAPSNTTIQVEVLKEASSKRGYTEYEVEIKKLFIGEKHKSIKVNKKAQLNLYESRAEYFLPTVGNVIEMKNIKVKKLLKNYREDEINGYELFLKSKGMEYILDANANDIVKGNISYKYVNISNMSYKAKIYLEDFLDSTLDFENSDILKSIIFGNQGYLSKDKLDMFSKTGTAHIMAVSGLHVGLMVLVVDRFLKLIKIQRNSRLYFTVIILILYGYMVYFPVSILRAGIMYLLYVIAYFLQRRYDSINALFLIAFILLIYRPLTIFSISFQLSFIATLSILLLSPILNEKLNKRIGLLSSLVSVTLAAQIGTLPIMAYHFKQISIISLVTNLLIIPTLGPMLSVAFISIFLGSISFKIGFLINQITNQLLNYINWIAAKCAIIPYGSFEVSEVKIIYIFGYYIVLGVIYLAIKNRSEKRNLKEEGLVKIYEL